MPPPRAESALAGLDHLPKSALHRLKAFVSGEGEAPRPVSASVSAGAGPDALAQRLSTHGELWRAVMASRKAFVATGIFSFVINILMLAGPLFMLQVYDRVMTSGSVPTLVALIGRRRP